MDILTRLDACAECEQAPLAPLLADAAAEIRMLRKDAARYRWLRDHGDSLGYLESWLPLDRGEWDAAIDDAMNGANAAVRPRSEAE